MDDGSIKLFRSILSSQVFAHQTALKIWIWCLCRASYKERYVPLKIGKGETTVKILPGQFIFGRFKAEEELGIDGSTIYKWIKKFESTDFDMISIESNNQYSIITINKWADYQVIITSKKTSKEQPSNNQVTAEEQPSNTNNKDNKDNKVNNDIENIIEHYHSLCPKLSKVKAVTDTRKKHIKARVSEHGEETLLEVFRLAGESSFLNGVNDKGWKADLDWLINPNNFVKVLEGKYKNTGPSNKTIQQKKDESRYSY